MKIAVVGLGGVGGYIGANLAKGNHEVVGFARGEHLRAIQKNGITIIEDSITWNTPLNVQSIEEANGVFDIVLFCVKSYDLKNSFEGMRSHIHSQTLLVSLANGVWHGEELRLLSDAKVVEGAIYILSSIEKEGVIRKKGKVFTIILGGEGSEVLKMIFDEVNLRVKISLDVQTDIWKKYLFISAFATMTSYYNQTIVEVYKYHYFEIESVLHEIVNLAKAKGIYIVDEVQKSLDTAQSLPHDSSTSMHLDFKNHKKTELETLSGYVVQEAKKYNLQTPLMEKMYHHLKELS
jgi:2-dehydropantoate 2-reductase